MPRSCPPRFARPSKGRRPLRRATVQGVRYRDRFRKTEGFELTWTDRVHEPRVAANVARSLWPSHINVDVVDELRANCIRATQTLHRSSVSVSLPENAEVVVNLTTSSLPGIQR